MRERFQRVFAAFANQAVEDVGEMNLRHHAVLLNALIYQQERDWGGSQAIREFEKKSMVVADSVRALLKAGKDRRETVRGASRLCVCCFGADWQRPLWVLRLFVRNGESCQDAPLLPRERRMPVCERYCV